MPRVSRLASVVGFIAFLGVGLAAQSAFSSPVVCLVAPGAGSCPTSPANITGVTQGVDFSVELFVDGAVDIGDYFVDGLTWSASDFTLTSATDTGLLGACALPPCFQYDDSVPGALSFVSFFDFGAPHSFTGSGALVLLTFNPLASGTLALNFTGSVLFDDSSGQPLTEAIGQGATVSAAAGTPPLPEPGSIVMVATGVAGVLARRRRTRHR